MGVSSGAGLGTGFLLSKGFGIGAACRWRLKGSMLLAQLQGWLGFKENTAVAVAPMIISTGRAHWMASGR